MEVFTKWPKDLILKLVDADIRVLWENFKLLEGDEEFEEELERVKSGIQLEFDIRFTVKQLIKEIPKTNEARLPNGETFSLLEYWDECELRENRMRWAFYSMLDKEDLRKRGGE